MRRQPDGPKNAGEKVLVFEPHSFDASSRMAIVSKRYKGGSFDLYFGATDTTSHVKWSKKEKHWLEKYNAQGDRRAVSLEFLLSDRVDVEQYKREHAGGKVLIVYDTPYGKYNEVEMEEMRSNGVSVPEEVPEREGQFVTVIRPEYYLVPRSAIVSHLNHPNGFNLYYPDDKTESEVFWSVDGWNERFSSNGAFRSVTIKCGPKEEVVGPEEYMGKYGLSRNFKALKDRTQELEDGVKEQAGKIEKLEERLRELERAAKRRKGN